MCQAEEDKQLADEVPRVSCLVSVSMRVGMQARTLLAFCRLAEKMARATLEQTESKLTTDLEVMTVYMQEKQAHSNRQASHRTTFSLVPSPRNHSLLQFRRLLSTCVSSRLVLTRARRGLRIS